MALALRAEELNATVPSSHEASVSSFSVANIPAVSVQNCVHMKYIKKLRAGKVRLST
jgi:hypothetical protein